MSSALNVTIGGIQFSQPFSVLVSHNPPLSIIDTLKTGASRYSGLLIDLIPQLFQAAGIPTSNTTFRFYETTYRANTGNLLANGSWSAGTIQELLSGRALFSVAPHTLTAQRMPYFAVVPVSNEGFAILVRTKTAISGASAFIQPFTTRLWILLICTMLAVALILYLVDLVTGKLHMVRVSEAARWRRSQAALTYPAAGSASLSAAGAAGAVPLVAVDGGSVHHNAQPQDRDVSVHKSSMKAGIGKGGGSLGKGLVDGGDLLRVPSGFLPPIRQSTLLGLEEDEDDKWEGDGDTLAERGGQHFLEVWLTLTQNCKVPRRRSRPLQLLYLGLSLFLLLITAAYAGQLTSILTVSLSGPEIKSLADLASSKRPFCTIVNSAISQYIQNGVDDYAQALNHTMILGATQDDCVAALRNGTVDAFLQHYILNAYYTTVQPCDLTLVDIGFMPSNLGLCVAAGNPLIPVLNQAMFKLRENGVLTALTQRWAYTLSQCAASGSSSIGSATLTLSQVYVLFFIVAIGLGIASVVVILERLAGAAGKTQVGQRVAATTKSFTAQITKSFTEGGPGALIARGFSRALSGDIVSPRAQGGTALGDGSLSSKSFTQKSLDP